MGWLGWQFTIMRRNGSWSSNFLSEFAVDVYLIIFFGCKQLSKHCHWLQFLAIGEKISSIQPNWSSKNDITDLLSVLLTA